MMTNAIDDRPGPGEARERAYRRRRTAIFVAFMVASGLAPVVLTYAANGHPVFGEATAAVAGSTGVRLAAGVAFTAALLGGAWLNWRTADEFRREEFIHFWAACGLGMLISFPLLHILGPILPDDRRLPFAYAMGLGGGMVQYLLRLGRRLGR